MKYNWPWCATCGHGVESIKREIDFWTGDVIYTVSCHGMNMVQIVTGLDLHDVTLLHATTHFDESPTTSYPSVTWRG